MASFLLNPGILRQCTSDDEAGQNSPAEAIAGTAEAHDDVDERPRRRKTSLA